MSMVKQVTKEMNQSNYCSKQSNRKIEFEEYDTDKYTLHVFFFFLFCFLFFLFPPCFYFIEDGINIPYPP